MIKKAKIYKAVLRGLWWMATLFIVVCMLGLAVLQSPIVQKYLVDRVVESVALHTRHQIKVGAVSLSWFDVGHLQDVELYDFEGELMAAAGEVAIDFDLLELVKSRGLSLNALTITNSSLHIVKYDDDTYLNLVAFINALKKDGEQKSLNIEVAEIRMEGMLFSFDDKRKLPIGDGRFDYSHFAFDVPTMHLADLSLRQDTIRCHIVQLMADELGTGFSVDEAQGDFQFNSRSMVLSNAKIHTPHSIIGDSLSFSYRSPAAFASMVDSVTLDFKLKEIEVGVEDLRYFIPVGSFDIPVRMSADVRGTMSHLTLDSISLHIGEATYFEGKAFFAGLPNLSNTFIDLQVKNARLAQEDIGSFTGNRRIQSGEVSFRGNLLGFFTDFVADGTFVTRHGTIMSDINLKLADTPEETRYLGSLSIRDFNLGAFLGRPKEIGKVTFAGKVDGKGLTRASAHMQLSAQATNSEFFGHTYADIEANGQFSSRHFSGELEIKDKSLQLSGEATIDFNQSTEVIDMQIRIDSADFLALGIARKPLLFSSKIDMNLREISLDNTYGHVLMDSIRIVSFGKLIAVNKMECQARVDSTLRTYTLTSEDFDVSLSGDFLLTKLVKDVAVSINEYMGMFDQNQEQINAYYKAKERSVHPYRADLTINARHPNAYLSYLGLPVTLSDQSYLEAVFSQKNDSYISVYAFADSVTYGDRLFLDNSLDINASKDRDSTGVLALFQISSKEQYWDVIPYTTGFTAEAIWSNDLIDLTLSAAQPANGSRADIHSEIRLANGTTDIHLLPSRLKVFDKEWNISRTNRVRFVDDKILFSNLELFHLEQSVKIDGVLSDSLATLLDISFEKFDLENLNTLIPKKLNGIVNGSGRFYRTSSNESMRFELGLDIREMMFEGVLLGDFTGISEWDRARNGLYLDFGLVRENINTMRINGYVRPGKTEELRIEARFDRANLNLLEPLFSQLVSGVDGTASGEFEIVGTFEDPEIYGFARVNDGRVTLDYLNTTYQFSGLTRFEDNLILLRDLKFTDRFGNRAILKGSVKHHRFTNFFTDLDIAHTNFELLNTNRTQNSLYYGNAYGTGTIRVVGPIENILIKAEATSMPNTRIYIPFIEEQSVEKKDYITFSAKSGLKSDEPANKKTNLTGITMDFDLNVTEDAYMELIFNPRTGDIIRGRGDGNLQLRINTSGDFEMFGRYEVRDGAYNFTTSLINKELQVKPGGSITWYGDPYAGILDIEATYRQLADISDWEAPQTTSAFSTPSQKYPVLVVLGLKGAMMSPAISFRMEMEQSNAPGLDDRWRQMLSAVNGNEEELKRQVFSLLVLRKFSRQNSFVVSAGFQSGLSSVSEFVSNQLSYWLNQVDENLEVSIDLNTLSPDAFNTFQLRLAYTFLDGRLRVTRGGGVTTVVDQNPGFGSILGDWSVEYVLTQDGRWRARVFSRANQLAVHQDMTGASFQFVQSFDELSEIFQKTRKQTVPDAGTDPPSID